MNIDEIEGMSKDFLNMTADIEIGKINPITVEKVKKAIGHLNSIIDKMPVDNKSIEDYQIIALCHQYYRFRDFYISQS